IGLNRSATCDVNGCLARNEHKISGSNGLRVGARRWGPCLDADLLFSPRAPTPIAPYTQGVRAGDYVFITGQISTDVKTGEPVVGSLRVQYETTFNNVLAVTEAA
ncbi:unnamed protein product, partial [Oppiella nova]